MVESGFTVADLNPALLIGSLVLLTRGTSTIALTVAIALKLHLDVVPIAVSSVPCSTKRYSWQQQVLRLKRQRFLRR